MIVLDTNIVSEAMRPQPDQAVLHWLDEQAAESIYITSVTLAELLFGIKALALGKRRERLAETLEGLLHLFENRILPFDNDAARRYADLEFKARAAGRGFPTPDGYIAAIAASRDFIVATRDTSPFDAAGVAVIDPWSIRT